MFVLILSSCGLKLHKFESTTPESHINIKPIFKPELKELVFNLTTRIKEDQQSGILAIVIDSTNRSNYRTVFMAKTGLKLFDFDFADNKMIVNHIIPQMDKRIVKKILEKDLRLLMEQFHDSHSTIEQLVYSKNELDRYRYKKSGSYYRLAIEDSGLIRSVDKGKKNRSHVRMHIKYGDKGSPSEFLIEHFRIPFSMHLISLSSN